ncbi:GSCFA domain-containing protein [Bergeyella sp. RCAD1439]|uniref:GSCFA domain-containing protein n=1 Tax=Bergeyella anatis TaxID=3113737 RepID=UPI002E193DFE|nr:GSCFA domain-containing protein [Bergeyella sp. RCAD1439]
MKFRTEVDFKPSERKIEAEDHVFSIGSCFASELSGLLSKGQMQTFNNPFGTVFNPHSIALALRKIHGSHYYREEDLVSFRELVVSLDHHTSFSSRYAHQTLEKINDKIDEANRFLRQARWVVITYGTAWIHEFLPKNKLVANCHKIPGKYFKKRLLSQQEISEALSESVKLIRDIAPEGVQILFTVSPVRHTKEGMSENLLSKAKLITAVQEGIADWEDCHYLPVYETMMDDLRDYRFYKEDMIHPTSQAVDYIFSKFLKAYFSEQAESFIRDNFKIARALEHRPLGETDENHRLFLQELEEKIRRQQAKVKHKIFQ